MKTIFIQIASYRDNELPKTITSCLGTAADPSRLRFGIVHQCDDETVGYLDEYRNDERFKIVDQPWQEARGVGQARRRTDSLYGDEDFYLQIDSHMRFEQNWDERLINQWQKCQDERAILSSYPPSYIYENDVEVLKTALANRLVVDAMFMDDIPTFYGMGLIGNPELPQRAAFASGGLQFGPGAVCRDVPYEDGICFIGEEIVHSFRLFVADYRIYTPIDQPIHHLYIRSKNQKGVHHFWKDFTEDDTLAAIYKEMTDNSYRKVREYLGGKIIPESDLRRFENLCGVDFRSRKVHPKTYNLPNLPIELPSNWREETIEPIKRGEIEKTLP